jgi:dipeptidyl aminopeptidase/acylaminoacyl peptidase
VASPPAPVRLPDLRAAAADRHWWSGGSGTTFPITRSRSSRPRRTASSTCCASTATRSGAVHLWNEYDGKIRHLLDPRPHLKAADFPQTQAVRFKARDGMELVGYLTLPKQTGAELPLIILPHGGPHGVRDSCGFDLEAAAFANAGYAVLKVNYRGSGGYGKDFHYKWYRHWGLEMQDDLEDGVLWAAGAGIADIDRVCIYGASYGGYASLMGVVKTPDRYQCAIGYVGVYDLNILHQFGDISR